jgi:hypothetical protein
MTDVRIGIDPKDHHNLLMMDLDALDQRTDDVTLGGELQRVQTIVDGRGEFLQPVDHQKQLDLTGMLALGCVDLCLHLLQLGF